jgi:2-phosphoglycolate phosphatase
MTLHVGSEGNATNLMNSDLISFSAVIFDFDGTLADSYEAIAASVNHVRARYDLAPLPMAEVKRHVGRGAEYLLRHTVPGGDLAADEAAYRAHHPSVMVPLTRLLPGAAELLHGLRRLDKRVGLCSNKPRDFSRAILASLGIAPCFDVVLGPEDVARPKPAPDMLLKAVQMLGLSPEAVLYVGDMTVDIETARAAGVAVWVVATGSDERGTLERARPDRLLGSLREMVAELPRA